MNDSKNKILTPKAKTYPQTTRSFELDKIAVERCKTDFPEYYGFKKALAKESLELADRLQKGLDLFKELKGGGMTLTGEQNARYKAFRNGAMYFINRLTNLAEHVDKVNRGEYEPTPYRPEKKSDNSNQSKTGGND
ncbi:hypothetical protein [Lonepinella sp. BR2474]|uniref:hypothetical protein n=1 Tax=Lonepinella sp. BR2474 TaxID=3434548 RepID=UPI003F6DBC88